MQLSEIDGLNSSSLARSLLIAAKKLGISNHFTLAKYMGVDEDSVLGVLYGGRPNSRTAERYKTFIADIGGEIQPMALAEPLRQIRDPKGRRKQSQLLGGKGIGNASRRPAVLPPVLPAANLGLHQQLVGLARVHTELQGRLTAALDRMKAASYRPFSNLILLALEQCRAASQQVTYLLSMTSPLNEDPLLKRLLNGDPALRDAVQNALNSGGLNSSKAKVPTRPKGRALARPSKGKPRSKSRTQDKPAARKANSRKTRTKSRTQASERTVTSRIKARSITQKG